MPEVWRVTAPLAAIRAEARGDAEMVSQLLYGEMLRVVDASDDWLKIEAIHDDYSGYVERIAVVPGILGQKQPHRFSSPQGHIYPFPDFKTPPVAPVFFLSPLMLTGREENEFSALQDNGWIFTAQIAPPGWAEPDHVQTALRFLETPYLWGGRSRAGIDCSGLVQLCVMAAGLPCLRDTREQVEALGHKVEGAPQRGDFVFFKGHVGIMIDERRIINATARHMSTVIEDIDSVAATYGGILQVRRL